MTKIIPGKNGNLARSLTNYYPAALRVPRYQLMSWMDNPDDLISFFSKLKISPDEVVIFNCVGIIDADTDLEEITNVNSRLPVFLSEMSTVLEFKLCTVGAAMELFPDYAQPNRYLKSKLQFFQEFGSHSDWAGKNLHVQLGVLFGGEKIHPKMFLGQIFQSINSQTPFRMTGGDQIREYHHIEDVSHAIKVLVENGSTGVINISSGAPIKLIDLARAIFNHFNSAHLLQLAALETNIYDNRDIIFTKNNELESINFRSPIEGAITWLEKLGVVNG